MTEQGRETGQKNHLGIIFLDPSDACDLCKSRQGHRVVPQGIFISGKSVIQISHLLGDSPCEIMNRTALVYICHTIRGQRPYQLRATFVHWQHLICV